MRYVVLAVLLVMAALTAGGFYLGKAQASRDVDQVLLDRIAEINQQIIQLTAVRNSLVMIFYDRAGVTPQTHDFNMVTGELVKREVKK